MAVWRQLEQLGSSVPWAREPSTIAEGSWEEVWDHRSSKAPLLGRVTGGKADHHRNIVHTCGLSEGRVPLVQAMGDNAAHAQANVHWRASCRLQVAKYLLCGLREVRG